MGLLICWGKTKKTETQQNGCIAMEDFMAILKEVYDFFNVPYLHS